MHPRGCLLTGGIGPHLTRILLQSRNRFCYVNFLLVTSLCFRHTCRPMKLPVHLAIIGATALFLTATPRFYAADGDNATDKKTDKKEDTGDKKPDDKDAKKKKHKKKDDDKK